MKNNLSSQSEIKNGKETFSNSLPESLGLDPRAFTFYTSPELMKEAITEAFDWITRSGYDVAGKDVWMAVYGPADDDKEFTSAQLFDLYIEHLKGNDTKTKII